MGMGRKNVAELSADWGAQSMQIGAKLGPIGSSLPLDMETITNFAELAINVCQGNSGP